MFYKWYETYFANFHHFISMRYRNKSKNVLRGLLLTGLDSVWGSEKQVFGTE